MAEKKDMRDKKVCTKKKEKLKKRKKKNVFEKRKKTFNLFWMREPCLLVYWINMNMYLSKACKIEMLKIVFFNYFISLDNLVCKIMTHIKSLSCFAVCEYLLKQCCLIPYIRFVRVRSGEAISMLVSRVRLFQSLIELDVIDWRP